VLAGIVVYALYRPHGTVVAGAIVIAAGIYELTPLKRGLRVMGQRVTGHAAAASGPRFALCCLGSTAGLMLVLLALGAMSVAWMVVITVVATAQKLLPPRAAVDVPLALAIITIGILVMTGVMTGQV
jgi:predicted metal-binding membrane protein